MKKKNMSDYWKQYWNTADILKSPLLQVQVGRTVSGEPIGEELWNETCAHALNLLQVDMGSRVLELCCGNGLLTLPVAQSAGHVVAIDVSLPMIETLKNQIEKNHIRNIVPLCGDVLQTRFSKGQFTHVFMYFALQHFSERETVLLFENIHDCLNDGGRFFIGDIPDAGRKWRFISTDKYERMYFDSIKTNTPAIGTWFEGCFLEKLAAYTGFTISTVLQQPENQINSHYRFDFIAEK